MVHTYGLSLSRKTTYIKLLFIHEFSIFGKAKASLFCLNCSNKIAGVDTRFGSISPPRGFSSTSEFLSEAAKLTDGLAKC